jgi:hypothetical protein
MCGLTHPAFLETRMVRSPARPVIGGPQLVASLRFPRRIRRRLRTMIVLMTAGVAIGTLLCQAATAVA